MRDPAIARQKLQVPSLDELAAELEDVHSGVLQAIANVFLYIDKLCYPPVGAIIAWHKNFSNGVPPLLENWLECNGQMVNDPTSPLHGVSLPNLNGDNRFLRGSNTSGNLYGDAAHVHTYAGTVDATVDTVEVQGGSGQFVAATTHVHTYGGQTDAADTIPPSMEVVWIIRIK